MEANKSIKIFFTVCWITGVLIFATMEKLDSEFGGFYIIIILLQLIVNCVAMLFVIVLIMVFEENREQFFKSFLLLLFNFPFVVIYIILINEILIRT